MAYRGTEGVAYPGTGFVAFPVTEDVACPATVVEVLVPWEVPGGREDP